MASLQASIAKHLTQKQLRKDGKGLLPADSAKPCEAVVSTSKPTASIAPVIHCDSEPASTTAAPTSTSDVVSDSDVGKGQDSTPTEPSVSLSTHKPSAVSLLHGNVTNSGASSSVNGDAEILDVQRAKVEAAVRTRSNSADAAGVIKVSWHGSDKSVGQVAATTTAAASGPVTVTGPSQPQGKNIVISTIKANNTVVTKVLPSGNAATSKVVLPPGVAARSMTGSSPPTSILPPRVLVQPSVQRIGVTSPQSQGGVPALGAAGTQTKIISVSTSTSGGLSSLCYNFWVCGLYWSFPRGELVLQWLPCQVHSITGAGLGLLVGPVSVYLTGWEKVWYATSVWVCQQIQLSEQMRPWDTLACCWDINRGRTHFWETAYSKRTTWKKLRKQTSR